MINTVDFTKPAKPVLKNGANWVLQF